MAGCHDKLGVPGTERGPAGGAVAAVGRAAAARADRDIGVRISPANTSSTATPPRPAPCIETGSRSEVKSQVCTDYDESEVIESFCIL